MKIQDDHFEHMRQAIRPLDTPERRTIYREGKFPRADRVKDIDKRYRWDLLSAAGLTQWLVNMVYTYANDTHIDTALRRIVNPL